MKIIQIYSLFAGYSKPLQNTHLHCQNVFISAFVDGGRTGGYHRGFSGTEVIGMQLETLNANVVLQAWLPQKYRYASIIKFWLETVLELFLLRSWLTGPSDLDLLVQQTVNDGFDGIEGPIPSTKQDRQRLHSLLQANSLVFIAEATTGCDPNGPGDWWIPRPEGTLDEHLEDLKWAIDHAQEIGALFVSTMCGYDAWSWQQNVDFFGRALELEKSSGITVSFETHRSRSLYNPWVTRDLLNEYPAMKLTCDFSHWCVVCERLLDTEWSILELCAERAQHIQCRVGYAQHAQVSDPRAPEHQGALTAHERWWGLIWDKQQERGMTHTTMMPEFLYDGYMQTLPYTDMPVADVWEITCWMAQRQRQQFAARKQSIVE